MPDNDDADAESTVLTPAGMRPSRKVQYMSANQTTFTTADGTPFAMPARAFRISPGAASDQPPAGHVLTPFGYRPTERVHKVEAGNRLRASSTAVEVVDLATNAVLESHPIAAQGDFAQAALGGGWIAWSGWTNGSGSPVTRFATTWTVPPAPPNVGAQTIFLFNGMEDDTYILQPVLQWGTSAGGHGNYWQIGSWFVASDSSGGQSFYSEMVPVNPGDSITGVMTLDGVDGGGYHYICEFLNYAQTRRIWTNPNELTWCVETLEAYAVASCDQYPPGKTSMRNIEIATASGVPAVQWARVNKVTDCSQEATIVANTGNNGEIDISYGTG